MKKLNHKGITFYLVCLLALLSWAAAIAYIVTDQGDITFSWLAVGLLVIGGALGVAAELIQVGVLLLAGSLCASAAFGEMLRVGLPSVSDIWNGVTFIGGNGQLALVFIAVFAVIALISCVLCFIPKTAQ